MKIEYTLFLLLAVTAGCSREDSQSSNMQITDSAKLVSTHKKLEYVIRDYYLSIEFFIYQALDKAGAETDQRIIHIIHSLTKGSL